MLVRSNVNGRCSDKVETARSFKSAWVERRSELKPAPTKPKAPSKRATGKASQASVRVLPKGDLFQPDLKPLLPPGATVWRGHTRGSWNAHYPPFPRCAYSWHMYGHRQSAVLCLRDVWEKHLSVNGLSVSDCPILNLFESDAALSALPGASAGGATSSRS